LFYYVKRRAFCLPWCFVMAPLRKHAHPRISSGHVVY